MKFCFGTGVALVASMLIFTASAKADKLVIQNGNVGITLDRCYSHSELSFVDGELTIGAKVISRSIDVQPDQNSSSDNCIQSLLARLPESELREGKTYRLKLFLYNRMDVFREINFEVFYGSNPPQTKDPVESVHGSVEIVLDNCYSMNDFNYAQADLVLEGELIESSLNLDARYGENFCVEAFSSDLSSLNLQEDKAYDFKLTLYKDSELVKEFSKKIKFAKKDLGDLWPGEAEVGDEDRCYVNGKFRSCQDLVLEMVRNGLGLSDDGKSSMMTIYGIPDTQRELGMLVLVPDDISEVSRGRYMVQDGAIVDPQTPSWASAYGYSQGEYIIRNGYLAIKSRDESKASFYTYNEFNGRSVLTGTLKSDGSPDLDIMM